MSLADRRIIICVTFSTRNRYRLFAVAAVAALSPVESNNNNGEKNWINITLQATTPSIVRKRNDERYRLWCLFIFPFCPSLGRLLQRRHLRRRHLSGSTIVSDRCTKCFIVCRKRRRSLDFEARAAGTFNLRFEFFPIRLTFDRGKQQEIKFLNVSQRRRCSGHAQQNGTEQQRQ